ncbi:anthranilate phosphoribosyltransferase [Corynebacterium heidelbergense]|uniref:Anthranilate phosphoribosyltransferase n=1 Tax=Corynebacterium heidelbergense TaxID=2055947 RepID=A0A364V7W7_9CORY|nr:anthranilate phosphoribosyltransferase [Corynebacterium heidelbergense]RAV32742.1 anthranilate phosphoribosyltransferase [Corynebacterium heidelbergense]
MTDNTPTSAPNPSALGESQLPKSYFTWPGVLDRLGRREELSESQVNWAMREIMEGRAADALIAAFAFGLRVKGISAAELASAAQTMRNYATAVSLDDLGDTVDIVGTGGDGHNTVNISTMASFVVAAADVCVIKHGNRKASSACGGADMLEALGVDIQRSPEQVAEDARRTKFAFLFAKNYHPAMRHAAGVRSQLGVPTVFNLLGPLTNPAKPGYGLIGCAFRDMMPIIGGAFAHQGSRVLVVRGMDGMDEISVCAPTEVVTVDASGRTGEAIINPREVGLDYHDAGSLLGGDATYNAQVARQLFRGELQGAVKDAVVLNAAAALSAVAGWEDAGLTRTLAGNVRRAQALIEDGSVARKVTEISGK